MGNCPLTESFPIKCCKYAPKVVLSYRYDNYNNDIKEINKLNNQNENKNIISPIKDERLSKKEINAENKYSIDEYYQEKSISSNKMNKNNSKIKYNNLVTHKRQLSTEEFIQLLSNKDSLIRYRSSNNLNVNIKNNILFNQPICTNFKNFMTKQTTSTTNSAQKLIFNLAIVNEEGANTSKDLILKIIKKKYIFSNEFQRSSIRKNSFFNVNI